MSWKTHGKTIVALLGALVMAGIVTYQQVSADLAVTASEWIMVFVALFGVATTWAAANITGFEKAKTLVAALSVVLNLLVTLVTGGLTGDEIMLLAVHFLSALGVAGAPAPKQVIERTVVSR